MAIESERRFLLEYKEYSQLGHQFQPNLQTGPLSIYQKYLNGVKRLPVQNDAERGLLTSITFPGLARLDIPPEKQSDFYELTAGQGFDAANSSLAIGEKTILRIRSVQRQGETEYYFTIKIKAFGHAGNEFEMRIPEEAFRIMRLQLAGEYLTKQRLHVGPLEIDRFICNGNGVDLQQMALIVEIEDDKLEQHDGFEPPAWLKSAKEITAFKGGGNNKIAQLDSEEKLAILLERLQKWQAPLLCVS